MNMSKKHIGTAVLVFGMLFAGIASATVVVMNFDGLINAQNGEYVDNYYNGGCGSSFNGGPVDCGGPNYGVVWSQAVAGGAPNGIFGNAANEPSAPNIIDFGSTAGSYMDVAAGFTTGVSFYYASIEVVPTITVYSGLNGMGSVLATLALPVNGAHCNGYAQDYSCWKSIGVPFDGTAQSVSFGKGVYFASYDNVTLGSATPGNGNEINVPEPAALGMFGFGVLLIGAFVGLRRRTA